MPARLTMSASPLPAPACLYQPAGVLIADGKESAAADAVQAARAAGGSSGIGATELGAAGRQDVRAVAGARP